jgi:hypothetical protein
MSKPTSRFIGSNSSQAGFMEILLRKFTFLHVSPMTTKKGFDWDTNE